MNPRRSGLNVRRLAKMNDAVLPLNCVIGLTAVDPAAVNADAHASTRRIGQHSET